MATIYHRFRPLRYRTTILSNTPITGISPTGGACAAFYPVCYYSESFVPGAVTDQTVASMPGSVRFQNGAKNIGSWVKFNPSVNVYSCQEATQGSTQAGFIILAINSGVLGAFVSILIDIEVSFIDRNPFSGVAVAPPMPLTEYEILPAEKDKPETVELRGLASALRKIALMHDIESNPGPDNDIDPL